MIISKGFFKATIGFEPMNQGVADPRLTTWLCRHNKEKTPRVGLEPTTLRLTAECSAIELSRNKSNITLFFQTNHKEQEGHPPENLQVKPSAY